MNQGNWNRLYNIASAIVLLSVFRHWLHAFLVARHQVVLFDDAYMFARYATNFRHGLGFSWNLDGVHTYGQTAQLWGLVVLGLSYLPVAAWTMLTAGSWVFSFFAVFAIAWACASNARSNFLSSTWRVLPLIALPLADSVSFARNQISGMETMLAILLSALYLGLAIRWNRGAARPQTVAVVGLLLFLTRPESLLASALLPLLLFLWMPSPASSRRSLAELLSILFAGVLLDLLFCKQYFQTLLPLSFYMKALHPYKGYGAEWHPELLFIEFLAGCQLFLAALLLFARRTDWRIIACCLVPALAVSAYLGTVTQIMGFNGRYYLPYLPFFIVPAILVLDRRIATGDLLFTSILPSRAMSARLVATATMLVGFVIFSVPSVRGRIARMEARSHYVYEPASLDIPARLPLPDYEDSGAMSISITHLLAARLPPGATMAASEVGYLGSGAPQINIIDLAGLNDNEIALHGFDMGRLLQRKPDIIWMPHEDYPYQRGVMFSDPGLLAQYNVYAGAADFGLAIRKDTPFRSQIDPLMQSFWKSLYFGYPMQDYLVRSVAWTGRKSLVTGD